MSAFSALEGFSLEGCTLSLEVRQARIIEQSHVRVCLLHPHWGKSSNPLLVGLRSEGRPPFIPSWWDIDYTPALEFQDGSRMDLHGSKGERELFRLLGKRVQPGGSLMVSYELFSGEHELHRETRRLLERQVPPLLTPVGLLLLEAGCWASMKDWYIPEGWMEGNKKLQGWKPLNEGIRKARAKTALEEIQSFLEKEKLPGLHGRAARVERILKK